MRQLLMQVPRGEGDHVARIAREHEASNISVTEARSGDGEALDVVVAHLSNTRVGDFVDALERIPRLHVAMIPTGAFALHPPADEVAGQVRDVTARSPLEIFVGGLQSIGSWTSFLIYAVTAGAVAWLAFLTDTIYLLVAAMLIAPFAGPAMNAAVATARGDPTLLGHSLVRYVSGLAVSAVAAWLLAMITGQETATTLMADVANVGSAAVVLPLAAGVAGAIHLTQSERSSLVSGAGSGMLITASLAPPAALIGVAAAVGEWRLTTGAIFLLVLQLAGINLAGAVVFRVFGLSPDGPRYARGRSGIAWTGAAGTAALLATLLWWQFRDDPMLQRTTIANSVRSTVLQVLRDDSDVSPVSVSATFTRLDVAEEPTIIVQAMVEPAPQTVAPPDSLRERLATLIAEAVRRRDYGVRPVVDITIVEPR